MLISRRPNYGYVRRKITSGQRTTRVIHRSNSALRAGRPVNFGGRPRDPRRARAGVYFHRESEIAGGKPRVPTRYYNSDDWRGRRDSPRASIVPPRENGRRVTLLLGRCPSPAGRKLQFRVFLRPRTVLTVMKNRNARSPRVRLQSYRDYRKCANIICVVNLEIMY